MNAPTSVQRWTVPTVLAVLGLALLLPVGAIEVGAAAPLKLLFPVFCFIAAAWVHKRFRPVLPAFVIALFAFSPFVRRLADSHTGFELFSPILLGPYFAMLPAIPAFVRRALGQRRGASSPFLVLAICMTYAALLALPQARFMAAANELIRWALPISLCTLVMERPADVYATKRALVIALVCILPVLSIYGLMQYVNPQAWDIIWMNNTRNAAIAGLPFPYQIRVYSMMNSAMSLAVFAASGFILLVGEGGLGLLVAALTVPVVALTMDRMAWVQCAIGVALLVLQAPPGRKLTMIGGALIITVGVVAVATTGLLPPIVQNDLDRRVSTFSSLSTDTSAEERLRTYDSIYDRLSKSPLGEGFGVNTSTAAEAEKRNLVALDSTVLEVGLTFGVALGPIFGLAILVLTWNAFEARKWDPGRLLGGPALLVSILLTSPLGSNLTGESGILTWIALGILLAGPSRRGEAIRPVSRHPEAWSPNRGPAVVGRAASMTFTEGKTVVRANMV